MSIHFSCTKCGNCCRNLRIPLSVHEARAWLKRDGWVQLFCDAVPWPVEPSDTDLVLAHKRRRTFPAMSGELPIRVGVTLVASFDGACPHLSADNTCNAYEERPRVCRIYPAEVNPFIELLPTSKSCPPEAWTANLPIFVSGGNLMDQATATLIRQSREEDARDASVKAQICERLGLSTASLANEGFAILSTTSAVLLEAITESLASRQGGGRGGDWRLISNRRSTRDALASVGGISLEVHEGTSTELQYLPFFPDSG